MNYSIKLEKKTMEFGIELNQIELNSLHEDFYKNKETES